MERIEDNLICPISGDYFDHPIFLPCCGNCVSKDLLKQWFTTKKSCPLCQTELSNFDVENSPPARVIMNVIECITKKEQNNDLGKLDSKIIEKSSEEYFDDCKLKSIEIKNNAAPTVQLIIEKDIEREKENLRKEKEAFEKEKELFEKEKSCALEKLRKENDEFAQKQTHTYKISKYINLADMYKPDALLFKK